MRNKKHTFFIAITGNVANVQYGENLTVYVRTKDNKKWYDFKMSIMDVLLSGGNVNDAAAHAISKSFINNKPALDKISDTWRLGLTSDKNTRIGTDVKNVKVKNIADKRTLLQLIVDTLSLTFYPSAKTLPQAALQTKEEQPDKLTTVVY